MARLHYSISCSDKLCDNFKSGTHYGKLEKLLAKKIKCEYCKDLMDMDTIIVWDDNDQEVYPNPQPIVDVWEITSNYPFNCSVCGKEYPAKSAGWYKEGDKERLGIKIIPQYMTGLLRGDCCKEVENKT